MICRMSGTFQYLSHTMPIGERCESPGWISNVVLAICGILPCVACKWSAFQAWQRQVSRITHLLRECLRTLSLAPRSPVYYEIAVVSDSALLLALPCACGVHCRTQILPISPSPTLSCKPPICSYQNRRPRSYAGTRCSAWQRGRRRLR